MPSTITIRQGAVLTVPNPGQQVALRVFEDADVTAWRVAIATAGEVDVTSDAMLLVANKTLAQLTAADDAIDKRKVELVKPLEAFIAAVKSVAKEVGDPVATAKRALTNKIAVYDQKRKDEIERVRAAEEKRVNEWATAQADKIKAENDRLAAAAQVKADRLRELLGDDAPVPPPKPVPEPVLTVIAAPIVVKAMRPAVAAGASMRKVPRLVINDPSKIPYQVGGQVLLEPKKSVILDVLTGGADVPGCEIKYEMEAASTRRKIDDSDPFA
jgi:hypothetical protein